LVPPKISSPTPFDRICRRPECDAPASPPSYFASKMGVDNVAHQVGTCRFGTDPQTSVLDVHCRTHAVDNL
jgi:choline dehydrogenase-like flavoprotein